MTNRISLEIGVISNSDFEIVKSLMTAIFAVENPNPANRICPEFGCQFDSDPRIRFQFGLSARAQFGAFAENTLEESVVL